MKNYIVSILFLENQAGVPGQVVLFRLVIELLMSSVSTNPLYFLMSINSTIGAIKKRGLLKLKTFNQNPSNKEQNKNPIPSVTAISKNKEELDEPLKVINGIKNQQVKNLMSLILGSCLAYCKSCSEVISQFSGINSFAGNTRQSLSLNPYKTMSKIEAAIGYITITNEKNDNLIKKLREKAVSPVIKHFGSIISKPDKAIIVGFLKNLSIFILYLKVCCI